MEKTLIAALNEHVRLPGESMADFAKQLRGLSTEDKAWFSAQFTKEFGYTIIEKKA